MKRFVLLGLLGLVGLSGCGGGNQYSQQPISAAPPAGVSAPVAAPVGGVPSQGVYNWQDVPRGQQVPINRAVFDQAGYQIYAASGETIAVPFANQNLYVMQFGRSQTGQSYFVNEGSVPVLYLRPGDFLENAAAQGARWYPLPDGFQQSRPVYVALAPSWSAYTDMGWYPGMVTYGGLWGYHPYSHFAWMPSFVIQIGGQRYPSYTVYHDYYTSHPGYVRTQRTLNYTVTGSSRTFGKAGGGGSFGSGRRFGATGSNGSFSGRRPAFGSSGSSFGSSRPANGRSFGTRRPAGSAFGAARPNPDGSVGSAAPPRGSFGSTRPSSGFGSSRPSGGSFGSGRSSGSSFGGGSFGGRSSSGSSFGGSRPSGGGFSSSGRSSGGSFGGGRSTGGGGSFGSRRR
jgi:hypothetical protein